jgi:hypothetical protein
MNRRVAVAAIAALAGLAGSAQAVIIDLTNPIPQSIAHNGALWENSAFRSAGTGVINSFVRIQANGTEQGYNTSGRPVPFDELTSANFTRDLTFGEVPVRVIGGVAYKEFMLDINQSPGGGNNLLSLDKVQIYTSATGGATTTTLASLGALVFDLDAGGDSYVKLDYNLASGSGQGDMRMLVPVSAFGAATSSTFIYLYSFFGTNFTSNDGFEEWAIQTDIVPLPAAVWAGAGCLAGLALLRRRVAR